MIFTPFGATPKASAKHSGKPQLMELICGLTPTCSANSRVKLEGLKEAERRVGDFWSYSELIGAIC